MTEYNEDLDLARRYLDMYLVITRFKNTPKNREDPKLRALATEIGVVIDANLSKAEESSVDTTQERKKFAELKQKLEEMLGSGKSTP